MALVGWHPEENGLTIVAAPVLNVLESDSAHPYLSEGARMVGTETLANLAHELGVTPVFIEVEGMSTAPMPRTRRREIETAMRPYCITRTSQRAVALVDISGFSLYSPEEQAAQLSLLSCSLNSAHQRLTACGLDIDLASTTTGDGFYFWNRSEGMEADAYLFCLMLVALADQAMQYRMVRESFVPTIRSCFGIGSHYTYYRPDHAIGIGGDYIVGDVTIELARLIDFARPHQILVSDFCRSPGGETEDGDREIRPQEFMEFACQIFNDLQIIKIGEGALAGVSRYLTGPKNADGTYGIRRREIVDKHGFKHYAYNAKLNIALTEDGRLYLGRQEGFSA